MIVLDASVVVDLLIRAPGVTAIEDRVLSGGVPLHAPHLIDVEVAQVLRRQASRKELSDHRGNLLLGLLAEMPLTRHPHQPLFQRIWALRENLTAYDATYVALAERLGATLLTRDSAFAAAPGIRAEVEVI